MSERDGLDRRTFIGLAAATLAGCTAERFEAESIPESRTRFPRTPMAGDVTSTRAMLAFHVADDSPVTLRVWSEEGRIYDALHDSTGEGFHKVAVDGLSPGTDYEYAVFGPDFEDRGLIGRFRTLPAEDAMPVVRFALMSCVGQGSILPDFYFPASHPAATTEPFTWEVLSHTVQHDLDALVHLGDQAYLDFVWAEGGEREVYLEAWGAYHGGGYRDVYPHAALYLTRDDHESTNNTDFDPWDLSGEDARKLDNAMSAWFMTNPVDRSEGEPVWRSFRWGQTVELVLLDCRYELGPDRLVSPEQLDFLVDRITNSPCRFLCIASPRIFSRLAEEPGSAGDREIWEVFQADRQRVVDAIEAAEARHVLFVAGDLHANYLGRTSPGGEALADGLWEMCITSGNANPDVSYLSSEQFEFIDTDPHLPIVTFDPNAGTIEVTFYGVDGTPAHEALLTDV